MLKVIHGGVFAQTRPAHGIDRRQTIVCELPPATMTPEDILRFILVSKTVDESCSVIVETYDAASRFAVKLAAFFTHVFPSSNASYENALCEILDAATVGFLRTEGIREPRDQLATFLASGVMAATNALMCYRVSQIKDATLVQWDPWEHGPLSCWAQIGRHALQFDAELAPTSEQRYATRGMLQQRLLRMKDAISIGRAGIDMQSFETF
jgi:hypothetical protein